MKVNNKERHTPHTTHWQIHEIHFASCQLRPRWAQNTKLFDILIGYFSFFVYFVHVIHYILYILWTGIEHRKHRWGWGECRVYANMHGTIRSIWWNMAALKLFIFLKFQIVSAETEKEKQGGITKFEFTVYNLQCSIFE